MQRKNFFGALGTVAAGFLLPYQSIADKMIRDFPEHYSGDKSDPEYWKMIREQFIFPENYAYMNTGGIAAMPLPVIKTVYQKMQEFQKYPAPGHDHDLWYSLKDQIAAFMGPFVEGKNLAFVGTATDGINIIINGMNLRKNDEVISSTHEHPALNIPLLSQKKYNKAKIKFFKPDRNDGLNNLKKIEKLITRNTRLIIMSHVSCTTGQVFPVKEIRELARREGILFGLDGAQAVGQHPLNISEIDPDFYTFSGHKWLLGPKRTGVLYVHPDKLETLQPCFVGAYSDYQVNMEKQEITFQPSSQRFEYATQNQYLYEGLRAGLDFLDEIGMDNVYKHNNSMAESFFQGLEDIPLVQPLSPAERKYRSSIISFKIEGKKNNEIADYLRGKKMRVRVVNENDLNAVRVSLHVMNQQSEVDSLLNAIEDLT